MLGVLNTVQWSDDETVSENVSRILQGAFQPATLRAGTPLATEIFLGKKVARPEIDRVHPSLRSFADRLASHVQTHTREFKLASKRLEEKIVTAQAIQARFAENATLMFAWSCVLSKLDQQLAKNASGPKWERDKLAGLHFMHLAHETIEKNVRALTRNSDDSMKRAAEAAYAWVDALPNEEFYIHEASPNAEGTGHPTQEAYIKQFPEHGDPFVPGSEDDATGGDGAVRTAEPTGKAAKKKA